MASSSWKDSVFFLQYDEAGGLFDHVKPMSTVNPDGIKPGADLDPSGKDNFTYCGGDPKKGVCVDFTRTGFRIPNIVISPFSKKHFVSHLPADYTAILKFIELRFQMPALTERDRSQPDISKEFFDFVNVPWKTPPPSRTGKLALSIGIELLAPRRTAQRLAAITIADSQTSSASSSHPASA